MNKLPKTLRLSSDKLFSQVEDLRKKNELETREDHHEINNRIINLLEELATMMQETAEGKRVHISELKEDEVPEWERMPNLDNTCIITGEEPKKPFFSRN